MSRNISTKHPGSNPVPKAASRNLAVGKKVVQPLPSKPQPNSILRLEEKVASARNELAAASAGGPRAENLALTLAQRRIVDSPRTNRHFRKVVARKVDFRPDEQIFSHLASLSVLEDDDDDVAGGRKKKPFERPLLDHDPEPRLEDFHRPFEGEETSAISDIFSLQNLVNSIPEPPVQKKTDFTLQRALLPKFFD